MRKARIIWAAFFFVFLTLAFLDFSGSAARLFGWIPKIQFWPALMSFSAVTVVAILAVTLVFGRVYCSVVCPLGVFQDLIIFFRRLFGFRDFAPPSNRVRLIVRWCAATIFIAGGFLGLHFTWLEPYSIYGRTAAHLFAPLYAGANNVLADFAAESGCMMFYAVEVVLPGAAVLAVTGATLLLIIVLAAWKGRVWCSSVCPVGTLLGCGSKFAIVRMKLDASKCVKCGKCAKVCRTGSIDLKRSEKIDSATCVVCFDCVKSCPKGAIKWKK